MNIIVLLIVLITLLTIVIWPPFIIVVCVIILLLMVTYYFRTHGRFPPRWVWAEDEGKIIVKWISREPIQATLEYKPHVRNNGWVKVEDSFDKSMINSDDAIPVDGSTRHSFTIVDLIPETEYDYRILNHSTSKSYRKRNFRFYTKPHSKLPPPDKPIKFIACGDSQQNDVIAPLESVIFKEMELERPEFILFMGDHVHRYNKPKLWYHFYRMMKSVFPKIPFYSAVGNHCGGKDNGKTAGITYMMAPFDRWNYTWTYQHLYFITVNSLPVLEGNEDEIKRTEAWLVEKINNPPSNAKFTIVMMHVPWIGPPYSQTGEVASYETYLKANWEPILSNPKVNLVFSGHKHSYVREGKFLITASVHGIRKYKEMRGDGKVVKNNHHYVIVHATEKKLSVKVKSLFGIIIDFFEIEC